MGIPLDPRRACFTAAFDAVLAGAGIRTVLCNIRTPRMNAIAERWIGGCRRELLDRTLIWNQAHLWRDWVWTRTRAAPRYFMEAGRKARVGASSDGACHADRTESRAADPV
jgi:hypothetical protein